MISAGVFFPKSDMVECMVVQGGFLCCECNEGVIFQFMYDMKAHHNVYHNTVRPQRFRCSVCQMVSEEETFMSQHLLDHFMNRRYRCLICLSCSFDSKIDIMLHLRQWHRVSMPYYCSKCGEAFPSELNVIKHAESRHNASLRIHGPAQNLVRQLPPRSMEYMVIQGGLLCCKCTDSVIFQTASDLQAHYGAQHRMFGLLEYMCSECNFRCTKVRKMYEHSIEHFPDGQYVCLECPLKEVCHECNIKHHLRAHGVQLLYSCGECGDPFSSVLNVIRHALSRHNHQMLTLRSAEDLVRVRQTMAPNVDRPAESRHGDLLRTERPAVYLVTPDVGLETPLNVTTYAESSPSNFPQAQGYTMNQVPQYVGQATPLIVIGCGESSHSNFSQAQDLAGKPAPQYVVQATPLDVTGRAQLSLSNYPQTQCPATNPVPQHVRQTTPLNVTEHTESNHSECLQTDAGQPDAGQTTSDMGATAGSIAEYIAKAAADGFFCLEEDGTSFCAASTCQHDCHSACETGSEGAQSSSQITSQDEQSDKLKPSKSTDLTTKGISFVDDDS